jgi:putrescine---pyruvate transaminase
MSGTTERTALEGKAIVLEGKAAEHVVYPFSELASLPERGVILFVEGSGMELRDVDGEVYLDALSGLINVNVGYGRAELGEVAGASMARLGFAPPFFGRGSLAAARLGEVLAEVAPGGISRFFFTVGGSDGVETAIKIARYYYARQGQPEKVGIVGRTGSYHGMSLGALSATGQPVLWEGFGPLVPGFTHIGQPAFDDRDASAELERHILQVGPERIAAFLAEPVSIPAGLRIPGQDYWPKIRELCNRYDILLIGDEVVTGFGRTGKMFAINHWNVVPDLLIMSKGLTSGYLPLGAVGMSETVYDVLASPGETFRHGFTGAGHPVACEVALRNLEIIEREGLVANAAETGSYLKSRLEDAARIRDNLGAVRGLGMLTAVDVLPSGSGSELSGAAGAQIYTELLSRRVLTRAFGDSLVIAPPLIATQDDIDGIMHVVEEAADACMDHA